MELPTGGTVIPSITEQPVKSLGKLFDSSLKDTAAIQKSTEELGEWLTKVDKSGLPVPVTTVESFERKISSFLRRWLGVPRSLNSAVWDNKLCKNQRGLKIHQAKMKCLEREVEVQRTGPGPGETQEQPGQEATHRSQSLHFDEDVSNIIQAIAKGDVDSRLQAISTIIVSYGSERFGRIEKGSTEIKSNQSLFI
ncbi:hypothetical protein D4764_14G0003790 [Takifugu flavidus]|uniref:Uncharacterized protein n=1 Tax=Takifugu flavidus TaxID=433684 RepID=A0A5C6P671_9TELE|nr:hypothetical protein D4764_14G0003790 [Takifugu flavidus]